ncbi:MAG: type I glyceraldehyde-3-phosphate dehydrogenase [Candidatus Binatia bacterium]
MTIRVGINGFGRIGRNILRAALKNGSELEFVAVNDITDAKTLAHLLKHDSVHGTLAHTVGAADKALLLDGTPIQVFSERDPAKLPWSDLGVDIVLECTGLFTDRDKAAAHLRGGAKKVIISAPAKGADLTICYGVNHTAYVPREHHVVSNASCTTNCLAPVAKVLHESFGIRRGLMTTIHAYTNDQQILDLPHKDLRRARAAGMSMIPTTTGAARAVGEVLPELKGKLDGMAIRVPTPNVSIVDLTAELERAATEDQINDALRAAAAGPLQGILVCVDEELVSVDFNGSPASSSVDLKLTRVMDGNFVKVLSWYDNEWGFSRRMVDVSAFIGKAS